MDTRQIRTLEDPSTASPAELEEALAHWDELDASSLARLDAHPEHGLRLRVLRTAESWLAERAPVKSSLAGDCPPAETLYEHGRGPGSLAEPLDPAITTHLEHCVNCAGLVASLESAPPLPLEWTRLEDDWESQDELESLEEHAPFDLVQRHAGRTSASSSATDSVPPAETATLVSPRFARWFPLAAAAALLIGVFFTPRFFPNSTLSGLPGPPHLRGAERAALHYPRGPVLADASGAAAPLYELAPVVGASEYRVELFLHSGVAFEEGQRVADLRAGAPIFAATPLEAGHYTWHAFATVDGLERKLGSLDFEIRADSRLAAGIWPVDLSECVERIRELHEAGYLTDARALARTLPESPEKEAYLLPPGR